MMKPKLLLSKTLLNFRVAAPRFQHVFVISCGGGARSVGFHSNQLRLQQKNKTVTSFMNKIKCHSKNLNLTVK